MPKPKCVTCSQELIDNDCPNEECPSSPLYVEPDLDDDIEDDIEKEDDFEADEEVIGDITERDLDDLDD